MSYYVPKGGLPPQTALTTDRARFTEAYAVIPARTLSDITASYLPGWDRHPAVGAGPAADRLRRDVQPVRRRGRRPAAAPTTPRSTRRPRRVLFVVDGALTLTVDGTEHALEPGGYAFLPPGIALDAAQQRRRDGDLPLGPQGLPAGRRARRARRPS